MSSSIDGSRHPRLEDAAARQRVATTIRVTQAELEHLHDAAGAEGVSLNVLMRRRLGLTDYAPHRTAHKKGRRAPTPEQREAMRRAARVNR